ncbi:MAG: BON domain-containing protein [Desulfuromonadales bacterium]|nr:BON domain-containing protein [Desulfuromonadales bacterium]
MKVSITKTLFLITAVLGFMVFISPAFAATTDSTIEEAVKNSYTFKTYLKDDDIRIQAKEGVVTLTGTVADESSKTLAGNTVSNLPDVKGVDNKLVFKGESSPDLWLKTKVKSTLLFHRNVSATTTVDVKNGIVTLRGEADNQAQKELTGEYAMDIEGVKSVNNKMTVNPLTKESQATRDAVLSDRSADAKKTDDRSIGDKVDDASISALVKATLFSHRSTSAIKTTVKTTDGVVTLGGIAGNDAEKSLAAKLANDVKGVKSVDNQMTVSGKITSN